MAVGTLGRETSVCKGTGLQNSIVSVGDSSDHESAAQSQRATENEAGEVGKGHAGPLGSSLHSVHSALSTHPDPQCQVTLHLGLHLPSTGLLMPNSCIRLIKKMFGFFFWGCAMWLVGS